MSDKPVQLEQEPEPEGAERRRHARVDVSLKARFLGTDNIEHPCLVVDISAGGAKLRAKTPPAEGETIVLYIDEIGRFECKVVRSSKHTFAVDYRGRRSKSARTADALTLALNQSKEHRASDRREAPRIKQDEAAIVTLESGEQLPCSIVDISLTGASLEISPRPPLGSTLIIGKTAAKVVRRHDKGVGVIFSGPAARMEDAIKDTSAAAVPHRGADLASHFGKKGS
ncbi:MAG TPA: PilZ domain-containing protein [Parvularculaceae bacterium]|nr:PilZ domain-containing protein [Parvularculaceae bacterium]